MEQIKSYFTEILGWLGKAALVGMGVFAVKAWVQLFDILEASGWSELWAFPIGVFAVGVLIESARFAEHLWSCRPGADIRRSAFAALAEMDMNRISDMSGNDAETRAASHAEWVAGLPEGLRHQLEEAWLDAQPNDIGRGEKS